MYDLRKINWAKWLIRIGLAFVYGYAAVEMFVDPINFLRYVPPFMQEIMPIDLFLFAFGSFEIFFTLWLLSGIKTKYAGILSAFLMLSIILPNIQYFAVLFRNVAIGFASIALFVLED